MLLTTFCIAATIVFLFLFAIWKNDGALNFLFKFSWLLMAVWAIICSLQQLGVLK